jgi:hypothetical protein
MNSLLRSSTISLYKEYIKCARKIPRGVARERFIRNIHDVFLVNRQFLSANTAPKMLEKYVIQLLEEFPALIESLTVTTLGFP